MEMTPYDGVAEFTAESIDVIKRARDDPIFLEVIRPDEERFIQVQNVSWAVGWEEVYVQDGKIVPDSEAWKNSP